MPAAALAASIPGVHPAIQVHFSAEAPGSPYDGEANDVQVVYRKGGLTERRLAYFESGKWWSWFAAPSGGEWRARLHRNGRPLGEEKTVTVGGRASADPFIRIDAVTGRFRRAGQPYFPIGHNLGWQSGSCPDIPEQIRLMAECGVNWTRIWACHWDGKNPYMMPNPDQELNSWGVNEAAFRRWDEVVEACAKHGVRMQFVLFHHGLFSQRVNPNWQDHPWNAKNGGWLADPADFFTDPRARKLAKDWLRIAVARYGHSTGIMAWELFNEVEWVEARYQERWPDIVAWHNEMAAHLRSLDPHGRLVTTSSELGHGLYETMDFQQPHTYPADITAAILGAQADDPEKPLFFGEFGPAGAADAEDEAMAIRDGIWAGAMAGHAGAGQYWFWDRVYPQKLYGEYKTASRMLGAGKADLWPLPVRALSDQAGDARLAFGIGWGETRRTDLRLPEDMTSGALGEISSYLQGEANRRLFPKPLVIRAQLKAPGRMRIEPSQASSSGGELVVKVNGEEAGRKGWQGSADGRKLDPLDIELPAGPAVIEISNPGMDWVNIGSITIPRAGPAALAHAARIGGRGDKVIRLKRAPGVSGDLVLNLRGEGMDGAYEAYSLDSGRKIAAGKGPKATIPSSERDIALKMGPTG